MTTVSTSPHHSIKSRFSYWATCVCVLVASFGSIVFLQQQLDHRFDGASLKMEELARLPSGEHLRSALLGYHELGADAIWLRVVQVLGNKKITAREFEWIYHALDVLTTIDPHYAYAYYVGGVVLTDLGGRVDLSNRLLEKGAKENPEVWNIPFLLGFNYYFILGETSKAADYISASARLSGGPSYLPGLATRMYAESSNPEVALELLEVLWQQTKDPEMREVLAKRAKEVIIEKHIKVLEGAVEGFRSKHSRRPDRLQEVVKDGEIARIPDEPFGGSYELNSATGKVFSTTHPDRLKVFRLDKEDGVKKGPYGFLR